MKTSPMKFEVEYPSWAEANRAALDGVIKIGDTIFFTSGGARFRLASIEGDQTTWVDGRGSIWSGVGLILPKCEARQAMRANTGKIELAYLLSFAGYDHKGWAADYAAAVELLGQWYRGELDSPAAAVDAFADACAPEWPELLARVSEFGAQKYARGNYLLGRGWHDTCNSLLRHVYKITVIDELTDPESRLAHAGHIMWNALFLLHCVSTEIGGDDRLRPPS